jgi:hypothetical protein
MCVPIASATVCDVFIATSALVCGGEGGGCRFLPLYTRCVKMFFQGGISINSDRTVNKFYIKRKPVKMRFIVIFSVDKI